MQAIITKYIGPTNSRGSRIKASASAGSVTIGYDDALGVEDNHHAAALALAIKMGWEKYGKLISGGTETGFVFVFEPKACQLMRDALGNLCQFVAGNRGNRDGNPYAKPEMKDALTALHYDETGAYPDGVPYNAADSFKTTII